MSAITNAVKLGNSQPPRPGNLYLGGGGSAEDEANLWEQAFAPGQRIVVWPFAQPRERWDNIMDWFTGALAEKGNLSSISLFGSTVSKVDDVPGTGLETADVVVVPGGNTFELLALLRSQDLIKPLKDFINRGGKFFGGSAGAVLAGADISIVDAEKGGLDPNTVQIHDTKALSLLGDMVINVHYEQDLHKSRCARWAKEDNVQLLCLPEKGGVVVDPESRTGTNVGPEDVALFSGEVCKILKMGDTFRF